MFNQNPKDEALARGLEETRALGQELLERERFERQHRERAEFQARDSRIAEAETEAIKIMAAPKVADLYTQRDEKLHEIRRLVAEYKQIDDAIVAELQEAENTVVPLWRGVVPSGLFSQRWQELRLAAGRRASHHSVDIPKPKDIPESLGATVVAGLVNRVITPGEIVVKGMVQYFGFSE